MLTTELFNLRTELNIIEVALESFDDADCFPDLFLSLVERKVAIRKRCTQITIMINLVSNISTKASLDFN